MQLKEAGKISGNAKQVKIEVNCLCKQAQSKFFFHQNRLINKLNSKIPFLGYVQSIIDVEFQQ